ncbi:hypothetical protein JNB62_13085 [Microbacterium jejuense]|uniref:Uncharacterized protein n=1 Tax=Microbacterium jejuense TaxID=1263637 RepID=A0ABS7HNT0_9MICO|nr:hypothetical protein [Microbacterium jejuense]MBW9094624.1 hypothetical protein [Microbacterium jejuense]
MSADPRPDALAEDEHPVTIDQVLALVDELANVSTPNPASGIVRLGLVTELRAELRPSLGSTGTGRGGTTRIPIDAAAMTLWEDITTRIQALPVDLGDEPATRGSLEQILNTWSRGLTAADAETRRIQRYNHTPETGLNTDALRTMHRRLERIRDLIDNHFNPPRRVEQPYCPECRNTHVTIDDDGEDIQQRALTITFWPTNPDRPALAACAVCGATWTDVAGIERLVDLITEIDKCDAFNRQYSIGQAVTITRGNRQGHATITTTEAHLDEDERAAVWIDVDSGGELIPLDRITPTEGDPT